MLLPPRGLADEQAIPAQRATSERSLETDFAGYLTKRAPFWRIRREYSDNTGRNTVKTPDNDRQKGDEYAAKQPNEKGAPKRPFLACRRAASALGELQRTPGFGAAILLALDHAR